MITDNFADDLKWTFDDALLKACEKISRTRDRMKEEFQASDGEIQDFLSHRYGEDIGEWYYEFITSCGDYPEVWRP